MVEVFKRFIRKKGREIGPYFYTSVRDEGGQVRSVYLGKDLEKARKKEKMLFAFFFLSILFAFPFGMDPGKIVFGDVEVRGGNSFMLSDSPSFDIEIKSSGIFSIFSKPEVKAFAVSEHGGKLFSASIREENGVKKIVLPKSRAIQPGFYFLYIEYNGEIYSKEFAWGLVALNTKKSRYKVGELAEFIVVVLDKEGNSVCSTDLEMRMTAPASIVDFGQDDFKSDECGLFETSYVVKEEGIHGLEIHTVVEGKDLFFKTSFLAENVFDFDIIRSQQTKIDPTKLNAFDVAITITPFVDASVGVVREYVPSAFSVYNTDAEVKNRGDFLELEWERDLSSGQVVGYTYSVPMLWPYLYELGPVDIFFDGKRFQEARPWYVAVDPSSLFLCWNILTCEQQGSPPSCACSQINYNDATVINPVTGLKTRSGTRAILVVNLTNTSSGLPAGITIVNATLNTYLRTTTGMDSCEYSISLDQGVNWAPFGDCTTAGSDIQLMASLTNRTPAELGQVRVNYTASEASNTNIFLIIDHINLSVEYAFYPVINLETPANLTVVPNSNVNFTFTPITSLSITNCSLAINGTINQTKISGIVNGSVIGINTTLNEGSYGWSINCTDTNNGVGFNGTRIVIVDLTDPTAFNLLTPANNTASINQTPNFTWQETAELNFANYTLLIDDDPTFASPIQRNTYGSVDNTSFALDTALAANTTYYWRVVAYDLGGRYRNSTDIFVYIVDTFKPRAFDLVSPLNNTASRNTLPLFDWGDSFDENFLNYTLEIDTDPAFPAPLRYYAFGTETNSSFQLTTPLSSDVLYYWRVLAYDRAGNFNVSVNNFTYITDNTAPSLFTDRPENVTYDTNLSLPLNFSVNDTYLQSIFYNLDRSANYV